MADKREKIVAFATRYNGESYGVYFVDTDELMMSFRDEAGAENGCDALNKIINMTLAKAKKHIESLNGKSKEIAARAWELAGRKPTTSPNESLVKSKEKTREAYTSASRLSFQPDNVTEKDKTILSAVEKLVDGGISPVVPLVAKEAGMTENQIAGALSVLVAKGVVSTKRVPYTDPHGKRTVRREVTILMDWRNLTPREKPKRKPKAASLQDPLAGDTGDDSGNIDTAPTE
jgi:hypothetical protein